MGSDQSRTSSGIPKTDNQSSQNTGSSSSNQANPRQSAAPQSGTSNTAQTAQTSTRPKATNQTDSRHSAASTRQSTTSAMSQPRQGSPNVRSAGDARGPNVCIDGKSGESGNVRNAPNEPNPLDELHTAHLAIQNALLKRQLGKAESAVQFLQAENRKLTARLLESSAVMLESGLGGLAGNLKAHALQKKLDESEAKNTDLLKVETERAEALQRKLETTEAKSKEEIRVLKSKQGDNKLMIDTLKAELKDMVSERDKVLAELAEAKKAAEKQLSDMQKQLEEEKKSLLTQLEVARNQASEALRQREELQNQPEDSKDVTNDPEFQHSGAAAESHEVEQAYAHLVMQSQSQAIELIKTKASLKDAEHILEVTLQDTHKTIEDTKHELEKERQVVSRLETELGDAVMSMKSREAVIKDSITLINEMQADMPEECLYKLSHLSIQLEGALVSKYEQGRTDSGVFRTAPVSRIPEEKAFAFIEETLMASPQNTEPRSRIPPKRVESNKM